MDAGVYVGTEVHLHVTGSISASLVPWWVHWFRELNPDVVVNLSITTSATQFVTLRALEKLANGEVWADTWGHPGPPSSVHQGKSGGSESIIIFPATLDTLMRLAQGRADSPALMMLQITSMPIVIADTLPGTNEIIERNRQALSLRENIRFAPRVTGVRANGRQKFEVGFNLPGAIAIANDAMKRRLCDD